MTRGANVDSLLAGVRRHDGRPALAFAGHELSYRKIDQAAGRLAGRLEAAGSREGARVALIAPNAPALAVAMVAAWKTGAACVPLSARLREYDLQNVLQDAQPTALISVRSHGAYSFEALVARLMPGLCTLRTCLFVDALGEPEYALERPGEAARSEGLAPEIGAILYTSGTTGAPKGALITHASLVQEAEGVTARLRLERGDTTALVIPATHAFGLACLLAALASGGIAVLVDSTLSLEPLIDAVGSHGATILHGSPTLFARLLKLRPEGLSSVRRGFVGGAACPPQLIERLDATGTTLLNLFGMTELGAACSCHPDDPPELRYTTVGRPLPGYEFRVMSASDANAGGELQVRGPYVTPGYFRRSDLTADAFDEDWFRTGDLGSIDERGYVRVSGRAKELVNVGGFNVFPGEVEGLLLTHPDVLQAAVIGVPDDRGDEALKAFVVAQPKSSLTPTELLRFARPRLAGYKLPYAIEIVPELPLLASGKPDRVALRERAGAALPSHA